MEIVFTFDCNDPRELFKIKVIRPSRKSGQTGFQKSLNRFQEPVNF